MMNKKQTFSLISFGNGVGALIIGILRSTPEFITLGIGVILLSISAFLYFKKNE